MSVACLRHTRVCLSTLAGVNGEESPVAFHPTLNETPARRSAPVESWTGRSRDTSATAARGAASRGDPTTLRQPRHLIYHAGGGQLRLRVRGWWYPTHGAERIPRDTVFREHWATLREDAIIPALTAFTTN